MWHIKTVVIPVVVGALGTVKHGLRPADVQKEHQQRL